MDLKDIANLINNVAKVVHSEEKFAVPVLAARVKKAAEQYNYDAPLHTMANILTKMNDNDKMFISRAELNQIFNKLYTPNTKLAEIFAAELDRPELPKGKVIKHSFTENEVLDCEKIADPLLSNALAAVFDKEAVYKPYSKQVETSTEKSCKLGLAAAGLAPKAVEVVAGQADLMLCKATYETPKGLSHVMVPVEVKGKNALVPTTFVTHVGIKDIDKESLGNYIKQTAGKSLKVDASKLLDALTVMKNGSGPEIVSDVQMAAMRVKAAKLTPGAFAFEGIIGQKFDEVRPDVQLPELPKDPEMLSIAERLKNPTGQARHVLGDRVVESGFNMVARKLASFGYKAQLVVSDFDKDKIVFAAAVDGTTGFKVPIKVHGSLVEPPTVAIGSNKLVSFSQEGIAELVREGASDNRALVATSPLYGLKAGDLLEEVQVSIRNGNLLKAEDAINVLGEIDPITQKVAIQMLMDALSSGNDIKKKASVSEASKCRRIIKNSASQQLLCGHLNVPLNKVYQDEHGECQHLHRKGLKAQTDTAILINHKLLF